MNASQDPRSMQRTGVRELVSSSPTLHVALARREGTPQPRLRIQIGRLLKAGAVLGVVVMAAGCADAEGGAEGTIESALSSTGQISIGPTPSGVRAGSITPPTYGGGPTLQPEIVSIYWGNFTAAQISSNQAYLQGLVTYISGSTAPQGQEPTVWQYGVRGARVGAFITDTTLPHHGNQSGHAIDSDVRAEITKLQGMGLSAYNPERIFMVYTSGIIFDAGAGNYPDNIGGYCGDPNATNCFCGYHYEIANNQWYGLSVFPYTPSGGTSACLNAGTPFNATGVWQVITSHEVSEAATDPAPFTGWTPEIGDQCSWGSNMIQMSFGVVQNVVDKIKGSCSVFTTEQPAQISAVSQVASGVTIKDLFALSSTHSVLHKAWRSDTGWQASWEDLGGTFTSPPVAIAGVGGPGKVDFVAQGTDNSFYHKAWTGTAWSPAGASWDTTGGNFAGPPALTSTGTNRLDVFGQGIDGSYYHIVKAGGSWSVFDSLGSQTFNGAPTVVTTGPTGFHIFGRSTNGSYLYKFWNGSGVPNGTWQQPTPGLTFISEPVVAQLAPSTLNLFGQGTDWNYYHLYSTNAGSSSTWSALQALGGPYLGPPAASWQSSSLLDMVGQFNDGSYNHRQDQSGTWAASDPVNGSGFGAGALLLPSFGTINLFIEGTDNQAYFKTLNGSVWSAWNGLGGNLH